MHAITRRQAITKSVRLLMGAAAGACFQVFLPGCSNQEVSQDTVTHIMKKTRKAEIESIKLTVVYDNCRYQQTLDADWGFSCLVEGLDKTILFDAGRFDSILMSNMSQLKIDPLQIDELVISHDHPDHIGGVMRLLEIRPDINVSLVKSFRSGFKKAVRKHGAVVREIDDPGMLTHDAISTGEMKSFIQNEHTLLLLTNKGVIILTGCAHPGVVNIVERAKRITDQEVLLVAGGFHLLSDNGSGIRKKASRLKELGVRYVAPTHCSGREARKIFARTFGDRFLDSGVGRIITANDLGARA